MAEEISKTGLWIDSKTGKLVKKQPEEGVQVVREGGRITSSARVRLDALAADPDAEPVPAAEALGYETGSAPDAEKAADTAKPTRKSSK